MTADDRSAEDDTGVWIADDLHEAAPVVIDQRFRRRAEWHLRDANLATSRKRVGLGEADVGDLGLGEDCAGRLVVVEMAMRDLLQTEHVLGHLAPLHRGHRRQR